MSKFTKLQIFKMQLPLFTNGEPTVLVYNERRNIMGTIPVTKDLTELFSDEKKIYVRGKWNDKTGKIEIDDIVEDQPW